MELHMACKNDDLERVKYLVEQGADVNAKDNYGRTVLYYTDITHFELLKYLVEHSVDVNTTKNMNGDTILHSACRLENHETATYLIEHGADINGKGSIGRTVLHDGCLYGDFEKVKYLVEHGADVNTKDKNGETALHWACRFYSFNSFEIVKYLLENAADVNTKDKDGRTALMMALSCEFEVTKCLVEHGADVYAEDEDGLTAIDWASSIPRVEILMYLRSFDTRPIVYEEERSVPEGATEIISYAPIEKGDKMVDFNNEFSFGRYYYQESLKYLRGKNPFTREPIGEKIYYIVK